ncbi:unnamed protein product [Ambrosiozyma monospora]|uniref:Unnamed protein product n=1 Tax=Ambrosiozyma monospora TaxID=43982 RepID=A0ACB5SW08_AMBMO|nr:unnamed protein product [Ambrosiozyma monospora]
MTAPKSRLSFLPSPGSTTPYWLAETEQPLAKHRTTSDLPKEVDVLIIGSGYSGTSVAFNLLVEEQYEGSVLMLEARTTCSGATGRNGGHFRSYYNLRSHEFETKYGKETAADLASFEHYESNRIKKIVKKYGIDCDLKESESIQTLDHDAMTTKGLKDYYAFVSNPFIPAEVKKVVKVYWAEEAAQVSDHPGTEMAVVVPTLSLWPYKLITGLLQKALDVGLNLQTYTPVTYVDPLDDGRTKVSTPRGEVIAKKVVFATNGYTKAILPEFTTKIVPR